MVVMSVKHQVSRTNWHYLSKVCSLTSEQYHSIWNFVGFTEYVMNQVVVAETKEII